MPRRKTQKLKKLPTALATPITVPPAKRLQLWESLSEKEDQKLHKCETLKRAMFATTKTIEKQPLLYQHYGLNIEDEGSAKALVLRLAIDYVPGFQVKEKGRKKGRKNVWNLFVLAVLWIDVQKLVKTRKCSERSACNILMKKSPWKDALEKGKARVRGNDASSTDEQRLKTLNNRYEEAKRSDLVKIISRFPENERIERLEKLCSAFGDPFEITFDA